MREQEHTASSLTDHLRVARRRKWVILQAVVVVPVAAILFSLQQPRLYEASSEVLLSRQNLAAALTDTPDVTLSQEAARLVETQANLARVPTVAARTLEQANVAGTPLEFLDSSEVTAKANADLLEFKVTHPSRAIAARLATEYAQQYTVYRRELDTTALQRARSELGRRLIELEEKGQSRSALYESLVEKEQQLRTMEALQTANAFVVRGASRAQQVQPRPVRNGLIGLVLGLGLGICLAFLREALDTRVRSSDEIADQLGMQMLGRLPEPPAQLQKTNQLVMLAAPKRIHAEAFRVLRTNVEFANAQPRARTIMVTSAVEREGKSTTVANLAVAFARSGKRVVLIDLDLRCPLIAQLFNLDPDRPGLTDVVVGHVQLHDAISQLVISKGRSNGPTNGNGSGSLESVLHILPAGPAPPNAGEFVGSQALAGILDELGAVADLVLIDAPPLLHVGDAMTLSAHVDALLLVTRLNVVRRPMLKEVRRVLDAAPALPLGFVLTGAPVEEALGYGSYSGYYQQPAYTAGRTKEPA